MRAASSLNWPKLKKGPIAIEAVKRIDAMFAIEREINGRPSDERQATRTTQSKPLEAVP
jgi:transposase